MRWMLLSLFAAALASPIARAHPVPNAIAWDFEGHGSAPGGADVPVSGTLTFPSFDPEGIAIHIAVDGVQDAITGSDFNLAVTDGAPGSADAASNGYYLNSHVDAPAFLHAIVNTEFETWSQGYIRLELVDQDGTAWSNLSPSPSNPLALVVPVYAPDAALFESRTIDIFQIHCVVAGAHQVCPNTGLSSEVSAFALTIDRFVDPVPEPPSFALLLLPALLVPFSARRLRAPPRSRAP